MKKISLLTSIFLSVFATALLAQEVVPAESAESLGNGDNPVADSKISEKVDLNSGDKIVAVPESESVPAAENPVPAAEPKSVPSGTIEPIAKKLAAKPLPFVGVAVENYNGGDDLPLGIAVIFVQKDSPAERAGILPGDILLSFDDQKIFNSNQFFRLVRVYNPHDSVPVKIMRGDKIIMTQLELSLRDGRVFDEKSQPKKESVPATEPVPARDDIRLVINGREYSLNDNVKKWKDRIAVTKDAIIIRTNEKLSKELAEMARRMRARAPATRRSASEFQTFSISMNESDLKNCESMMHSAFMRRYIADGYCVTLRGQNGERTLTVEEIETGKVLFDGPVTTPEQLEAVPAEVKAIADKFHLMF